jgi:hypothetical protein
MKQRLLSEQDVLDFAVDKAMDVSQGIYEDAIALSQAIGNETISDGDACVEFRELREKLDEALEE